MSDAKHKAQFERKSVHIPEKDKEKAERGCVTKCLGSKMPRTGHKHGSYRKNGYDEISSKPEKIAVYNRTFSGASFTDAKARKEVPWGTKQRKRMRTDPTQKPGSWEMKNAKYPKNFRYAHTPYNHDFHHIMPMECLIGEDGLEPDQVKLLMKAEYNLNHGRNLIILPRGAYFAGVLELPYHASNHPNYIARIKSQMARLKQHFNMGDQTHKEVKATQAKEGVMQWEDAMFKQLCAFGAKQLSGRAPDVDDIDVPEIDFNPPKPPAT